MSGRYIEPCCAGRQLPPLLASQRIVSFQTNGDVTLEHFVKAVSCIAGNKLRIELMVPSVDVDMLRVFAWYGRQGWLSSMSFLTAADNAALVFSELHGSVAELLCCRHSKVTDGMIAIHGENGTVVLQGHLSASAEPGYRFYSAVFGPTGSDSVKMFTATFRPYFGERYRVPHPAEAQSHSD